MVYDGAATALYALRQEIGDAAFRTLLREWPQRNAHRAVTTQDYIALASEIAGRDLSAFLNTWLYGRRAAADARPPDLVGPRLAFSPCCRHGSDSRSSP